MADVTYYFGAGASAQALPTYSNFRERLEYFLKLIKAFINSWGDYQPAKLLNKALEELINEMEYHDTPDLVVKKYFHLGEDIMVYQVKNLLNTFFIFEQTIDHYNVKDENNNDIIVKKRYDKRYDALIARILKPVPNSFELPSNFKVITWNYDYQFELSCFQYMKGCGFNELSAKLQSMPRVLTKNGKYAKINMDQFAISHLNGLALLLHGKNDDNQAITEIIGKKFQYKNTSDWRAQENLNALKEIIDNFEFYRQNSADPSFFEELNSTIFFGWENLDQNLKPDKDFKIYEGALKIARQTDILVICGYSFPDFNANIDKMILGEMQGLKKVYIQSKDGERIKNIIKGYLPSENIKKYPSQPDLFELSGDYSQFLVPSEFNENYKIGRWNNSPKTL